MATKYDKYVADRIKNKDKYKEEEQAQQYANALKEHGIVNPNATTITAYSIISNEVDRLRAIRKQNVAANLNQTAKNAMNRMVIGGFNPVQEAPATNRLKQGIYTDILNRQNSQIENELHIINDQAREKDDPAVLRAQETLKELEAKRADTQKKLGEVQKPLFGNNSANKFEPKIHYSPETNAYIRRVQEMNSGLAKRMTQKQGIPSVWNRQLADFQHMINAPESADSEEYVNWLEEGRRIGQYGDRELNAMLRGVGQTDPAKVYAGMDDKEKSSWFNLKDQDMLSWNNAMEWLAAHPDGADAEALRAKRQHFHDELANRYYNDDEFWQDEREAAINRMGSLNGKWLTYTPEGERMPVNIMGRKGNYETPEQMSRMDELLYDAVMGQGAYQDEINGYEGTSFRDQHMRELNERISRAWDAYESANPYMEGSRDELFDILTGRDAAHDAERVKTLESERGYLRDQINELDGKLSYYDQRNKYLTGYQEWNKPNETADDAQFDKGKYNPNDYRFTLSERGSNNVDDIYSFIIGGKERQSYIESGSNGWGDKPPAISKDYKGAMLLMPEEINIFKNMYEAGRKEEASAFLDGLQFAINQRYVPYEEIQTREEARAFPILNSVFSQAANLITGVQAPITAAAGELGAGFAQDPNSDWYAPTRYAENTQSEIASMLGPETGKLYLNTMNTMRNVINGVLLTKMGIPAGALPTATLATFGTQIYQEQMYRHLQEDRDFEKANALAVLDTALEIGEELLPIETMFATAGSNVFVRIIANMLAEGGEEFAGATAGEVLRGMITGRYAWEKRKDEIFNEGGYTDKDGNWIEIGKGDAGLAEAHKQAMREWGEQIVENTVAGALGGGMGATYGSIQNYTNTRKTGIQVNDKEGGFNTLLEAARAMDKESDSKKLADQLYSKQQKGKKISYYQTGKLAQTMYQESGKQIQDIIKGAMTRKVEAELKEEGASAEYAGKAAPIIAETVTTGKQPRKADIRVIAKEDAGVILLESYMTGEKSAEETIKEAGGEAAMNANKAVREVLGVKPAKTAPRKGATDALRKFAPIAKADDVEAAEGPRHDNGLDAVVDGHIVSIQGRSGDNYIVVDENNNERTVNKNDVRAVDERMGLLMEYADRNRNIIDDDTFREMAVGLKDNPDMSMDDYIRESTRAYINYRVGAEVKNSRLADSTLNMLKEHAQRKGAKWDEERIKTGRQQKVTPGKGTVTYNGVQYGTNEWLAMAKKLGTQKARELRLIGEIGVRLGNRFEIVERPDLPDAFGWEDEEGTITINLAAESSKDSGRNRSVLTVASHELTHWLQQNSPEQYRELAKFVFNGLRQQKVNIADRVIQRMEGFQATMGRTMTVDDALAEIVADACDQVLTNEQTIRQLEEENKGLYNKIKAFVKNFVDTVMKYTRNEKGEVITDNSYESRKIRDLGQEFADELTRKWMGARAEALEQQKAKPAEAKENAGKVSMSTREAEDQGIKDLEYALANPHVKFSMREPIEATKDGLVAVHNLRENEFYLSIQEGGLTAPSIAIIHARTGHSKYGDVSVVFSKDAIDPEKMLANRVYGADAWTPTRGNAQIATKLNYEVLAAAREKLSNILTGDAKVWEYESHNWINQWLYEDETSNTIDDMIDKAWTNDGVIMAYYLDNGNKLEMQKTRYQNIEGLREEEIPMYNAFLDGLAEAGMRGEFRVDMENNQIGVKGAMDKFELIAKYKDIFRKGGAQEEKIVSVYDEDPNSKIATNVLWRKIVKSYEFLQDGRQIKTTEKDDIRGTAQETRYKINKDEFGKWIKGLVGKALGKRGVYNGRDPFTRSGEKRSFEQLYMEPTAENIVRAMYANHERKGGEAGGATGLMAKASKEYRNIAEVREDAENRLKVMDDEEYKQLVKDLDKRINEFAEKAKETAGWDYYTIREMLIEAGGEYARAGEDAVRRYFKRENIKLTEKQINEALELMKTAQEIPAGYFEAKPERVVGLDEIKRVILPESASQELFNAMNERGIPYDTYDGTDEDRLAKLNSVENVQFSTRDLDSQYTQAVKSGDRETAQLMVDAQAIKSGFTTEDAYHGTAAFGFTRFDMDASAGAVFVAFSPKVAGTYVDNGDVRMIGKRYPLIGLDIMNAEQLAKELQEYYRNLPKTYGYETASEWTVKGIDKDDYVDFVFDYAEKMKKLAAGKSFEKEVTRLVDKMVALAHTGDEKAAYQVGVDLQRKFKTADYFGQDELENRRLELSAMMIPALAKGEDVININMHGLNYYLSRSDVIRQLEKYNQDQEGIYRFYTRPGNQLLIDAKGANWNKIWIEDEQLRNDMWAYFNPTEAYEEARGINTYSKDMFTVTTRELSEYARYRNYSSVRINDVYDHGGRGDWDRERGHGDIAMFFDEQDVKSADPVTYDEDGDVIPLSKRFDRNVYDLRFSTREPDMEVNHWMMGLTESSLRTTQERMLWNAYKESRGSLEVAKKAVREIRAEMEAIEKKENPTAYEKHQLGELNRRLNEWTRKRDMYEEDIIRVTTDKGYAALMYRERNKMENLVNGRTEDEVRAAIDAIQAEMDTVEKEMAERNAKLKELAERETVKSIRNRLNSAGLRRIAAKLKADLGSELANKEIENRLALLALKMKQGKVDSSEIMELADMLVGTMRPAYDDYVLSELRGMTIALNSSELETLKNRGMNVRDLQRELTGTGIRIVANGPNTIDKNWDELTATFPTLDREANPGDMLYGPDADHKGIMDLVEDAIRQQKAMGPDSDQVAAMVLEAASDLVPEILTDEKSMKLIRESMEFIAEINQSTEALDNMENLFNRLRKKNASAKATLGKLENQIVDAIEYNNELAKQNDVSAWKRDRAALIERLKSEHTQKMLEEQTKYREKIARFRKAQELMADNQAARREIHMNVNRIRRLLVNETDSKNVPEHMKSLAREMVEMILRSDQVSDRKITAIKPEDRRDALRMIQAWNDRDGRFTLSDLQQIPDEEVQSVIENALADIEEGVESYTAPAGRNLIENLSNYKKALTQIQDGVEKITNVIEAEQTAVIDGQKRRVDHLAYGVVADLDKSKRKGEWIGFGNKALTAAQRSVIYGNTTPVYFMKNLRNSGMNVIWNGFGNAENRKGLLAEKTRKHMQGLADKYHYENWDHEKNIDVILNGVKVPMKLENMMALYATWTREQQMGPEVSQHMEIGGVYIEDEQENKGLPHREHKTQRARRVKQADIDRIEAMLTQEQKDYIRDVVAYLSNDMSELGNEASMAMYGIRKYNEKYYFPMKVWDGVKSARSDKGISGTTENRIAHKGWDKRRKHKAKNALVIGKFTDTAVQHIDEMTNYVTFAPVIEGLNKVLNWQETTLDADNIENKRNLRVMFQEAYGKEALRYLEDWMKDLQGGVTQDQRKTLRDRLISTFKKMSVAGSLSVTLQQPLSYIRAGMMINPKYLAAALSPQYWKGSYQEMMDHSGVAVIKQMGKFDMNFGQSTRDWIAPKTKKSAYEKISDVLTAAPQAADTMTWTRMWSAVKMEQHAQHPDMDIKSEDFLNLVGKRFNEVMRRTQVYDSVLTKSSNMRSQALSMKLITSFMAEPTLSLNVLADAIMNVKEKGGKSFLAKAGALHMLSAVLQAAVKGFMGAGRSPDEKKTAAENLLNKFLYNLLSEANPASLIPGYSDLVEVLKNGELKDDALSVLGKLKSVYTTAQNILNPEKSKGPWRDVEDTAGQILQMFTNIPLKNLMRDARAMYNWATGNKFADRPTSGAVITYQGREMLMNGDNLLGVINSWLGDAGYKTSNKAYYTRMYNAMTGGNQGEAEGIREYLELAKGQDSKKVQAGLRTAAREDDSKTPAETSQWMIDNDLLDGTSSITTQYKKGEITREEAEGLYRAADPKMKDDDIFWKLDQMDYEKETGETETGYYYRLRDAITKNKAEEIQTAVKTLLAHGITKEKIKDKLSDWKAEYIAGDSAKKIQIRDAITKAYKAAGYTAEDAKKTIDRWTKDASKATPEKKDAKDTTGRWGRGNIDLNNRKVVQNDDGSISTERSFSVNIDGKEVLLPTVIDGKIVSEEEAIRHYEQTGQYLGKFNTVKEAEEYAEKLHNRQDWYYNQ